MSENRIHVVNVKGGAEYQSINDAVKAALEGDTIQVHVGQYDEVLLLDRAVHIVAESGAEPTDVVVTGGAVCTANGSVTGISFRQLVDVRQGRPTIRRCDISLGTDGVRVAGGADALIQDTRIYSAQSGGDGVYVQESGKATIADCELFHHRVNAIHINGGEATVTGCKIHDCPFGVYFRKAGKGLVERNIIEGIGRFGIYLVQSSDPLIVKNDISNCGISGIMISQSALGQLRDNTVNGTVRILRGCSPTIGSNTIIGHFDNENNALTALNTTASAATAAAPESTARVMAHTR